MFNRTKFELERILKGRILKKVKSNWRMRTIDLYEHPEDPDRVVSIGWSWVNSAIVIADESREDWKRELNAPNFFVITE